MLSLGDFSQCLEKPCLRAVPGREGINLPTPSILPLPIGQLPSTSGGFISLFGSFCGYLGCHISIPIIWCFIEAQKWWQESEILGMWLVSLTVPKEKASMMPPFQHTHTPRVGD